MGCRQLMSQDCHSCLAMVCRPSRCHETFGEETQVAVSSFNSGEVVCDKTASRGGQEAGVVLQSLTAFIGPILVTLVVVQSLESRVGALLAAIAGLVAAALTVVVCAGLVKRRYRRSGVAESEQ